MKLTLALLTLLSTQVMAQSIDSKEFLDRYIERVNSELEKRNIERREQGKKEFCPSLNKDQEALIYSQLARINSNNQVDFTGGDNKAATDFVSGIADQLECYPLACDRQRRSSLFGVICNAKAYNKDLNLLIDVLEDVSQEEFRGSYMMNYYVIKSGENK